MLTTDANKLLMQWKGPFRIKKVIGKNDHRVDINGKTKTYHANLLKRYIQRKNGQEVAVSMPAIATGDGDEATGGGRVELRGFKQRENYKDVSLGSQLTQQQRTELRKLTEEFGDVFMDVPGTTRLVEHKVNLTTKEPVRTRPYLSP